MVQRFDEDRLDFTSGQTVRGPGKLRYIEVLWVAPVFRGLYSPNGFPSVWSDLMKGYAYGVSPGFGPVLYFPGAGYLGHKAFQKDPTLLDQFKTRLGLK